jgi:cytochrome c biogenesis protein CcdA
MKEKYSGLDPATAAAISDTLSAQALHAFDKVVETDKWLTQSNFLVNTGGAIAVMSYLGTSHTSHFAIFPLVIFLVGIVASGIEIRALLKVYGFLHQDALRRREGFVTEKLSVGEAATVREIPGIWRKLNGWCGVASQVAFVLGATAGVAGFYCGLL